jgi:tetratricopeptide (TPR) repeat protein
MRLTLPFRLSLLIVSLVGAAQAQEPTAALRQADADYREGVSALNRNELETARTKFEEVIRLAPGAEQGHSALGAVLVREGHLTAGTRELEKALDMKPNDGAAQLNLAMVYAQAGLHAKAILLFAKLEAASRLDHHPLSVAILEEYARSLQATGQTHSALVQLKQAVAQEGRNGQLHDQLGSLYAIERNWEPAEQQFREAITLTDDSATAHLHLGLVLSAEQKAGAVDEWMKAYSLAPADPRVALAAGRAIADAGNDSQALPILEHAVQLDQKSVDARYQLALVLQRLDRTKDAIELLKQVVEADPKNSGALTNLGTALAQVHDATEGIPFLTRAIALSPKDATAHQDLAAAYIQVNQIDDAVGELKTAIKLAPNSPQLHYDLGTAYKLQDNAADAIPELETAEKLNPSGYEPAYVLGLLYMQVGHYAEAARQLESSLKLHPQNGEGWATLGSVYSKLDRLPEAATALREAIKQMPTQADSHLIMASVLVKQKDTAGAALERKIAADLMRQQMDLQRAEVATNSGKSLLESGKLDDAIAQFREALTFDPKFAEAHSKLAEALERQGKTSEAAAERARADALSKQAQ